MTANDPRRGMALVAVLWSIAFLSVLAMAASLTFRGFVGIMAVDRDRLQGDALLTGGLEVAAGLATGLGASPLLNIERTITLSTGSVRAQLSDEGGRIDIGKAPVEVLSALFRSVGAPAPEAEGIAQRISALRKRDNAVRDQSPQAYSGPTFTDIRQLAYIAGAAPEWVAAAAPLVTVFGSETVNPMTAPPPVIAALPGVGEVELRTFLEMRQSLAADAQAADADRLGAILGPAQQYVAVKPQRVVSVELTATLTDGYAGAAQAVIVLLPNDSQPYRVLVWNPRPSSKLP
jgi:general secretion pathway protein K